MRRLLLDLDNLGLSRAAVCLSGLGAGTDRVPPLRFAGVEMSDGGERDESRVESLGVSGLFEARMLALSVDGPASIWMGVLGLSSSIVISESSTAAAGRFRPVA